MEIFLLIILLLLITYFYYHTKSKLLNIENKLFEISNELTNKNKESAIVNSTNFTAEPNFQKPSIIPETDSTNQIIPEPEKEQQFKQEAFNQELDDYINEINNQEISKEEIAQEPIELFKDTSKPISTTANEINHSWYEKIDKNNDLEKFIGENLISKIGIAILVLGIGFFVKYAIDQNWINEVARVGIGILAGGIILGFAHFLRENFKAFSTVLVAGAISVFYFTIGFAFHQYHLFNQTIAFSIMLVITAFSVLISMAYNRQELAILSIIGGFATPFMVSTGSGNYVVLFTYIIILDLGMLVLAFTRKWTLVNIITYVFTMVLYVSWLLTKGLTNHPEFFTGALLFATVFYFIFIAMNIAYNLKYKQLFKTIDFSILLSNTFIFYGIGICLLNQYHPTFKGAFTLVLALSNCLLAWFIIKNNKADKNLLYVLIGLGLTFITLAAPVQLTGNYITLFWAAEGALLLWLAQKSGMTIFRFGSVIIYVLAAFSLFMDWNHSYTLNAELSIFVNKGFIAGLFMCVSAFVNMVLLKKDGDLNMEWYGLNYNSKWYLKFNQIALIVLVYLTGLLEIRFQLFTHLDPRETAIIITGVYHFMFTSLVLYFLNKQENEVVKKTLVFMGLLNVILFVIYFNNLPFQEIYDYDYLAGNLCVNHTNNIGFVFHYVSLICVIYQIYTIHKILVQNSTISTQKLNWMMVIIITFLASSEVLLHTLKINMFINLLQSTNLRDAFFENLDHVLKQTVKVLFPILWGVLSFVFLWFGIKEQLKHLRIAALYLLALTLVKLVVYDIREVSEGGKILAFILLGIVLLIISFMYQKIKAIIINEDPKESNHEENI